MTAPKARAAAIDRALARIDAIALRLERLAERSDRLDAQLRELVQSMAADRADVAAGRLRPH